jgi:endoglucanase
MRFLLALLLILISVSAEAAPCAYHGKDTGAAPLRRGINLSNWWQEGKQTALSPQELGRLRRMGFDFVRLPIALTWLEQDAEEARASLTLFRCDVAMILNSGLDVVVDLHSSPNQQTQLFSGSQQEMYQRLYNAWAALAQTLKDLPAGKLIYSIYNEPALDMSAWWPLQGELVRNLRAAFPNRIVASAGHGGWDLTWVKPYPQRGVMYDFHFYVPLELTHYGAEWFWGKGSSGMEGVWPNPSAGWTRDGLATALAPILNWKRQHGAALVAFELGVYRPHLDAATRANWLKDARSVLEEARLPWALWEYRGSFGLINERGKVDPEMAKALGLAYN